MEPSVYSAARRLFLYGASAVSAAALLNSTPSTYSRQKVS